MTKEEILLKFLLAKERPSRYNITRILDVGVSTLRRLGFIVSELQKEYDSLTEKGKKHCLHCDVKFFRAEGKFCSRSCAGSFNGKRRQKEVKCLNCDKPLHNRFNHKFCNTPCHKEYQYNDNIRKWKSGELGELKTVPNYIRKYLFIKFNHECCLCGWNKVNPVTNKIPLEIDHIDGNHKNNSESNLRLICPNCHSLTPTFRALNKGNGREYRRNKPN